jgi:hypothetical protein
MEQVLDLYAAPANPDEPLIAMDESSIQLLADVHQPLPIKPGQPRREDDQYERRGVAALFMFFNPLAGWRRATSSVQRTKRDWAWQIKRLLEEDYPLAHKVHLLCDNLNIHDISSLYEAFPPQEAHRLCQRLQIHYTPKHGSWLNVAEIELSVMQRQCLDRRIESVEKLDAELAAWSRARNREKAGVHWQFTTSDARTRLRHLYPPV